MQTVTCGYLHKKSHYLITVSNCLISVVCTSYIMFANNLSFAVYVYIFLETSDGSDSAFVDSFESP